MVALQNLIFAQNQFCVQFYETINLLTNFEKLDFAYLKCFSGNLVKFWWTTFRLFIFDLKHSFSVVARTSRKMFKTTKESSINMPRLSFKRHSVIKYFFFCLYNFHWTCFRCCLQRRSIRRENVQTFWKFLVSKLSKDRCTPNTELFLVLFIPYSDWIRRFTVNTRKYEPEKHPSDSWIRFYFFIFLAK